MEDSARLKPARFTEEFQLKQKKYAVRCLFRMAGDLRCRGKKERVVHGERVEAKFTNLSYLRGMPRLFVKWSEGEKNENSLFYKALIAGVVE